MSSYTWFVFSKHAKRKENKKKKSIILVYVQGKLFTVLDDITSPECTKSLYICSASADRF